MLTKSPFITFAICFSSVMIMYFSTSVVFVELKPLSLKYTVLIVKFVVDSFIFDDYELL